MGLLDGVFTTVSFHVDGLITYLVQLAYDCMFAIFYPFYALIKMFLGWLMFIWYSFFNFVNGFIDLGNSFIGYCYSIFSWIPMPVLALLIIGMLIVVGLTVYSYLKDIEIAGFKI